MIPDVVLRVFVFGPLFARFSGGLRLLLWRRAMRRLTVSLAELNESVAAAGDAMDRFARALRPGGVPNR